MITRTLKKTWLFVLASAVLGVPDAGAQCPDGMVTAPASLLANGDFSLGAAGIVSEYEYVARHDYLPGGFYSVVKDAQAIHRGFAACRSDHTGSNGNMLTVNGTNVEDMIVWQTSVDVKPDTTYFFSTWVAHVTLPDLNPARLRFSINGAGLGAPFDASGEPCAWRQFFTTWSSGSAEKATISIVNKNLVLDGNDFALDDITFYECVGTDLTRQLEGGLGPGQVIELRNVFFDTDEHSLRSDSYPELDRLRDFLMDDPELEIVVAGHTDDVGSEEYNRELALNRAKAVCAYLRSAGIDEKRCGFVGWGETRPVDSNQTYEGRQKNRRVELSLAGGE